MISAVWLQALAQEGGAVRSGCHPWGGYIAALRPWDAHRRQCPPPSDAHYLPQAVTPWDAPLPSWVASPAPGCTACVLLQVPAQLAPPLVEGAHPGQCPLPAYAHGSPLLDWVGIYVEIRNGQLVPH